MKNYIFSLLALFLLQGCGDYKDIVEMPEFKPISISVKGNITLEDIQEIEYLKVKLDNYNENIHREQEMDNLETALTDLLPGLYNITIDGKMTTKGGETFMLNGTLVNYPLVKNNEAITLEVKESHLGDLIFSEIYYAGSPKHYFRDQFYEIYNNANTTIYLDGLYFANLTPGTATNKLPQWPQEDEDNYCYAERVWRFPGSGTDYPLKAGESCVVSQFAANHQLSQYNPDAPIDCSTAEFEFNMNNPKFPDQPAKDMEHVFYNGLGVLGRVPQYLTSVFGGAYVIFKVPDGELYDPVNNTALQTKDLASSKTTLYAKIPINYVLDAVECGHNETKISAKRVPGLLDSGMTWVGNTYNKLAVARKVKSSRADGTPIYQDTNNSTDDFERGVTPLFRRNGEKMPSWNHSLN